MESIGLLRRSQALRKSAGSAFQQWGRLMLHTDQLHEFDSKETQFPPVSESETSGVTLCGTTENAASAPENGLVGLGARSIKNNIAGAWAPHLSARPLVQQRKAPHSSTYARCIHSQVTGFTGQQIHKISARAECRTYSTDGDVDVRGKVGQKQTTYGSIDLQLGQQECSLVCRMNSVILIESRLRFWSS
jgi:hypothetical protein